MNPLHLELEKLEERIAPVVVRYEDGEDHEREHERERERERD